MSSPMCYFYFKAGFQLEDLNLSLSVKLRNDTLLQNLFLVLIFFNHNCHCCISGAAIGSIPTRLR